MSTIRRVARGAHLPWKLRRLRAMSLAEVAGRVADEAKKTEARLRVPAPSQIDLLPLADVRFFGLTPFSGPRTDFASSSWGEALLDEAERYLHDEWLFFGFSDSPHSASERNWYRDDSSGKEAPRAQFGPSIDYRNPGIAGNVKYIWEKSRHHHTTVLALAYWLTNDDRFARAATSELSSWIHDNPPFRGINWTSQLELGIRIISWTWTYHLLRGHRDHEAWFAEDSEFWRSLYAHSRLLSRLHSHGSSANNHLLGELAGLYLSATALPAFAESEQWRRDAKSRLEEQARRQTFPSGLNREMGFEYHLFSTELLLLPYLLGKLNDDPFSPEYEDILKSSIAAVFELADVSGNLPRYGDADGGLAVQVQARRLPREAWLYTVGRHAFHLELPTSATEGLQQLLGLSTSTQDATRAKGPSVTKSFLDAGFFSLATDRGSQSEILLQFDAGVHGFLSIAGHGHADALAVTLSVGGQPIFIDPGTYVYHAEPAWREYFRSTSAHNTVEIDGLDQSEQAGPFLWSTQAQSRCHTYSTGPRQQRVSGSHDGYWRLSHPVLHTRDIRLEDRSIFLTDEFQGTGHHAFRWHFHLHPACRVRELEPSLWRVQSGNSTVILRFDPRLTVTSHEGELDPPLGWYSASFGKKCPTTTLRAQADGAPPVSFGFHMEIG